LATGGYSFSTDSWSQPANRTYPWTNYFNHRPNGGLVALFSGSTPGLMDIQPGPGLDQFRTTGEGILIALQAGGRLYTRDNSYIGWDTVQPLLGTGAPTGPAHPLYQVAGWSYLGGVNLHRDMVLTDVPTPTAVVARPNLMRQIIVNGAGQRIVNERSRPNPPANSANHDVAHRLLVSGRAPYWLIFDSNFTVEGATGDAALAVVNALQGLYEIPANSDWIVRGGNVAALASAMGVPAGALQTTINQYNSWIAANVGNPNAVDPFGKPTRDGAGSTVQVHRPIDLTANYLFAVQVFNRATGNVGGIVTGENGEVINRHGRPISNLFAAGEMANRSLFGESQIGGASLSFYSTMGRRVGNFAASQLVLQQQVQGQRQH